MTNSIKPAKGDVWFVDLDPVVGTEQAKLRPCLVISADGFNSGDLGLVVIVPITSRYRQWSWFVTMNSPEGGLPVVSYVITNQPRTVSLKRFGRYCGVVLPATMQLVEERLQILFDL